MAREATMAIGRHKVPVDGVWHDCPSCGYQGGWHVFFKKTKDPKTLQMDLQCPGCKEKFDLGLEVQVAP